MKIIHARIKTNHSSLGRGRLYAHSFGVIALFLIIVLVSVSCTTSNANNQDSARRTPVLGSAVSYRNDTKLGDDMIEALSGNSIIQDAVTRTDAYVAQNFDRNAIISSDARVEKIKDGGRAWSISSSENAGGGKDVVITFDKNGRIIKIAYDEQAANMKITYYEPIKGEPDTVSVSTVEIDVGKIEAEGEHTSRATLLPEVEKIELQLARDTQIGSRFKNYWHSAGAEGKKQYLSIGCKSAYRIRTDNLSGSRKKQCESYKANINECNTSYARAADYGFEAKDVGAILSATIGLEPAIGGVSVIGGAILRIADSLESAGVTEWVSTAFAYLNVERDYAIIKKYA